MNLNNLLLALSINKIPECNNSLRHSSKAPNSNETLLKVPSNILSQEYYTLARLQNNDRLWQLTIGLKF